MHVTNVQVHYKVPFEDYLKMPGFSHSFMHNNGKTFAPTAKMRLGSEVDNYLNDPEAFTGDIAIVKPLAMLLKKELGPVYALLDKQVSLTALMHYNGYVLNYKGRPDLSKRRRIIVDEKVAEDVDKTEKWYGYDTQISGYGIVLEAQDGMLLAVSPTKIDKETGMNMVKKKNIFDYGRINTWWWEKMIMQYGHPE